MLDDKAFSNSQSICISEAPQRRQREHELLLIFTSHRAHRTQLAASIKREFSVARTPQQNGVAERKNRTLIEVARTMLVDSKLPTTFWAEAVNTACYVQNSKAFRVFNSRTRIVEENLHVQFNENTPNIARSGPNWIFDIDALTKSMNYEPVVAGNQSNDPSFSSSSKDSPDAGFKPSREEEKKDTEDPGNKDSDVPSTEEPRVNQKKDANVNNTNNINIVSPIANVAGIEDNAVNENIVYGCADDPNIPNLEEIVYSDDDEDVGTEADMNNLDTFIPIGCSWVHTQEEGINYDEVFAPVARIKAIRLFLAYASFKDFVVYQMDVKSAFLYGKIEEEVYRGKIDKTLFIKRDKSDILLVQVYVDDIIFGSTKKKMCTEFEKIMHKKFQMSSMGELTFFLGLQVKQKEDGIFISQDKYATEILKKFGFSDVKTASTPMETHKPLLKDADGEDVDEHLYRSMIRSLMYLTSSRPDIMFVTKIHIDNESTICIVKNPVFHSKTKHIEIRHHFIRDSNEKKLIQMIKIHTDHNVADLLTKAFDVSRFQYLIASIRMLNL
ncbi:putative ribonuclease H-like domain-containing protein [Tanacetum coccineum]